MRFGTCWSVSRRRRLAGWMVWGRRAAVLGLATLAVAAHACLSPPDPRERLATGVWRGEQGPWVVALEFETERDGLAGVAHVLVDGKKWTEAVLTRVELEAPELEWHLQWGESWRQSFRGRVDFDGGTIEGDLLAEGAGAAQEVRYERVPRGAVEGLLARATPAGEHGYSYRRPSETGDGWKTATPEEAGLEQARIERLVRAVEAGEGGDIHSLLVVVDGLLVAEEYFHGWSREDLHRTASCTKSVASLLVGIALDQGRLEGLEVPVLGLLPELAPGAAPGWRDVRLDHLLTMTAGLDRTESDGVEAPGRALLAELLAHPVATAPGTRWRYANAEVDLLAAVLRQATGLDADDFAQAHLFGPLGIESWEWQQGDDLPSMAAGLSLRPRAMARIGWLVAGQGSWQGRRIVSADWIERSTRPRIATPGEAEDYGYLWWSAVPTGAPTELRTVYAKGVGSQFMFVVPKRGLVVTVTGGNHANGKLMAIAELLERHLFVAT